MSTPASKSPDWSTPNTEKTTLSLFGATQVFERGELFRRNMGNLDLIVHMHNSVETTLLPVERPLLQQQLDRIDSLLSQGIGGDGTKKPNLASSKFNIRAKSSSGSATSSEGGGGGGGSAKGSKKKAGHNPAGSKKAPGKGPNAPGGESTGVLLYGDTVPRRAGGLHRRNVRCSCSCAGE